MKVPTLIFLCSLALFGESVKIRLSVVWIGFDSFEPSMIGVKRNYSGTSLFRLNTNPPFL